MTPEDICMIPTRIMILLLTCLPACHSGTKQQLSHAAPGCNSSGNTAAVWCDAASYSPCVHFTSNMHEERAIGLLQGVQVLEKLLSAKRRRGQCRAAGGALLSPGPWGLRLYLLMMSYASSVPMMHSALTAAYVGARCGCWPGPPPKPPSGLWHSSRNWHTLGTWPKGKTKLRALISNQQIPTKVHI